MNISDLRKLLGDWAQYRTSRRVEKDANIWVFGAMRGRKYFDNAKYLFQFVSRNTRVRAVWVSKDEAVVDSIRSLGFDAYTEDDPDARYYIERAGVAVITHRGNRHNADLPFHWMSEETFLVQLWHGIPLKMIAFDDTYFSFRHDENSLSWRIKASLKRRFFPFRSHVNHPDLVPASSEETRQLYSSAFRVSAKSVVVTGYPRSDKIFQTAEDKQGTQQARKVIYMPTFRGAENSDFDLFDRFGFDTEKLDAYLSNNQLFLDIKLHPFNNPPKDFKRRIEQSTRINMQESEDIYEVLHEYQLLITDYSSIYFDYLLPNRPIIFAPFDKESFLGRERDFYFNYDDVTPGPQARNWGDVMRHIERFLESPEWYAKERHEILTRFHTLRDNRNCERIFEAICTRAGCVNVS